METRDLNKTERVLNYIASQALETKIKDAEVAYVLSVDYSLVHSTRSGMECARTGIIVSKNCATCVSWNGTRRKGHTTCPKVEHK